MRTRVALFILCLTLLLTALPAQAQYAVRGSSNRATGENYRIEIGGYLWNPSPDISIASESLPGILGDRIDFVEDLGLEKKTFKQLRVVLRPGKKHKFRFEYTPIKYEQPEGQLRRNVVFNGILYSLALPVATTLDWKAYRFTYEYDLIYRDRGFFGILLEAKYTDVRAELLNVINNEFVHARAPIPAVGAIGRVYVAPNISITGEFSGFRLPEGIDENYRAKYFDFDLYGTVNFTDKVGAQAGYRSFDVFYRVDQDEGELKLKGLYFGGVVRF
ncbi:MAG: hypothetical protein H0W08_06875 [Acidobacteria bacterium]|nr:hypothetical protein [Acidobacteriota bacterium]